MPFEALVRIPKNLVIVAVLWAKNTGYGMDDRGVGVRLPVGSSNFSFPRRSDRLWAHPTFYPMIIGDSFPCGKPAGAWGWPLTSSWCRGQENVDLYIEFPTRLHGVVLN
jgi:hypothetical protein